MCAKYKLQPCQPTITDDHSDTDYSITGGHPCEVHCMKPDQIESCKPLSKLLKSAVAGKEVPIIYREANTGCRLSKTESGYCTTEHYCRPERLEAMDGEAVVWPLVVFVLVLLVLEMKTVSLAPRVL